MAAVHRRQLGVGDVLEGDVEVFADLRFGGHHLDHVVGEGRRIGVVQPDPLDAVDAAEPAQQFGQHAASVEVDAVIGRVLRDDDQLADPAGGELARLLLERLHRHGYMRAADERDGAVAAHPVAALRDFQVGVVLRGGKQPFGGQLRLPRGLESACDAVPGPGSEVGVHLGNLRAQVVGIALRETADDEQPLDLPGLLGRRRAQNHVDGLLLGIADESAGVDHHRLGVGAVAVEHDFVTGRRKAGHQVLRIDRIL